MTIKDLFEQKLLDFYGEEDDSLIPYGIEIDEMPEDFDKDWNEFSFWDNYLEECLDDITTLEDLDYFICENLGGKIYKTKEDYKRNDFITIERLWS